MSQSKLKLLMFDAVNTIIKVNPSPAQQYAEVAHKHGVDVKEKNIEDVYEDSWNNMKLKYPNYGIKFNMKSEDWWKIFINNVFNNAGYSERIAASNLAIESITKDLYSRFATKESWIVVGGVHEVLAELKASGLKLAVVSNFDERLSIVLSALNLRKNFDFLVTSVSARAEKPDSSIFVHALKQGMVEPRESIHIGDSLEEDFFPAKNVGIQPYLFLESGKEPNDEVRILVGNQYLVKDLYSFKSIVLNLPR